MRQSTLRYMLLLCLPLAALATTNLQSASREDQFLRTSHRYLETLTVSDGVSANQKMMLAVSIAASELGLNGSPELPALFRQLRSHVSYVETSDTSYAWESGIWEGTDRETNTYNSHLQRTQHVDQTRKNGYWVNEWKEDMTYDANRRLSAIVTQTWNGWAWVNESQYTLTYDASGQVSQWLAKSWLGYTWVNTTRLTFTYSSDMLSEEVTQVLQYGSWVNQSRTTYEYDGYGNSTIRTVHSWSTSGWQYLIRTTIKYVAQLETEELTEVWNGSAWVKVSKTSYAYDGTKQVLEVFCVWSVSGWTESYLDTIKWEGDLRIAEVHVDRGDVSVTRTLYHYDGNGNEVEIIWQRFTAQDWVNETRFVFVYRPVGVCGDFDVSDGLNIADVVYLVNFIFRGGPAPLDRTSGDIDCDSQVTVSDVIFLVSYLFSDGLAPCDACL